MPYPAASVPEMIERCALDAVAICSPIRCHAEHLALALDAKLHVFCEKPLIWEDGMPMLSKARQLGKRFTANERVLHLNTQWVDTLPAFRDLHPLSARPRSFEMTMSPPVRGAAMLPEALPHPVSLLVALGATGPVSNVQSRWSQTRDALDLRFTAAAADNHQIDVSCGFRQVVTQPRDAAYAIDGCRVDREVDLATYAIRLRADGRSIDVTDPVRLSVQRFLDRVRRNDYHRHTAPLYANVQMLDELAAALSEALKDGDGGRNP